MKTLFIECNMGASGDMLMGALYELLAEPQKEAFLNTMNALFPDQVMLQAAPSEKCGIWGTKMHVVILRHEKTFDDKNSSERQNQPNHSHHTQEHFRHLHTGYHEMLAQIESLPISDSVKEHAKAVYSLIGSAESQAHNTDISQIHFHEVGTLDAVMDVVGCCLLLELLAPEQILA